MNKEPKERKEKNMNLQEFVKEILEKLKINNLDLKNTLVCFKNHFLFLN